MAFGVIYWGFPPNPPVGVPTGRFAPRAPTFGPRHPSLRQPRKLVGIPPHWRMLAATYRHIRGVWITSRERSAAGVVVESVAGPDE
jgi:hypothetical protein